MISVLSQKYCTSAQASLSMDLAKILPNAPSQMDCIGLHIPMIDDEKYIQFGFSLSDNILSMKKKHGNIERIPQAQMFRLVVYHPQSNPLDQKILVACEKKGIS